MNLITKENIMDYAVKSVIVTTAECAFEALGIVRRPITPETYGSTPNVAPLLRAIEADIKDLDTPAFEGLVSASKALRKQGKYLESIMSKKEMDDLISFADSLHLSLAMLRNTRLILAKADELGENAFKREYSPYVRYLNFFEEHLVTESKIMAVIRHSFVMAYTDALEVVKRAAKPLGYKVPDRLELESGYIEEVFSSVDMINSISRTYARTEKCCEKANFAGIMTPTVGEGIMKYSVIQTNRRRR